MSTNRELLSDRVEDGIRQAILSGRLRPSQSIDDRDLQALFGVSRTPVREALLMLEQAGLVVIHPNRGARVVDTRPGESRSALHTLGVLMRGIVRTADQMPATERSGVLGMIDDTVARLEYEDHRAIDRLAPISYHRWAEVSSNRVLRSRCHLSIDGLSYRIRIGARKEDVPWEYLLEANASLRDAVTDRRTGTAVEAIERMHFMHTA